MTVIKCWSKTYCDEDPAARFLAFYRISISSRSLVIEIPMPFLVQSGKRATSGAVETKGVIPYHNNIKLKRVLMSWSLEIV